MTVTVKLFAILREKAGQDTLRLNLNPGQTVAEASRELAEKLQPISQYLNRVAFAVNREYVPKTHILQDGDELAIIPPVSGGAA